MHTVLSAYCDSPLLHEYEPKQLGPMLQLRILIAVLSDLLTYLNAVYIICCE